MWYTNFVVCTIINTATNAQKSNFPLSLPFSLRNKNAFSKCLGYKCHICGNAPKLYLEGIHHSKCFNFFNWLQHMNYALIGGEKRIQARKQYTRKLTEIKIQKMEHTITSKTDSFLLTFFPSNISGAPLSARPCAEFLPKAQAGERHWAD